MNGQTVDRVGYADHLVNMLLHHGKQEGLVLSDVIKGVAIALIILKAIYPDKRELFSILQEAEGELELLANPMGEC